jgi:glycosyltransferase involved in cell wall biosynthesis
MCDVWLCGSWVEGFGLTILEAMACRCPAVSTRAGGPEEIIEEGVTGHLVPAGDSAALADRLAHVLRLPDAEWRAMSDAAHARARSYSWDDAADLFESALARR